MIVEIQLATERLQRQLRSTLIASSTCTDQTIPTGDGATRYVDHIEWGPEGTVTVSRPLSSPAAIEIAQTGTIFLASFDEMKAAGHGGVDEAAGISSPLTLHFSLSAEPTPTGANLTIELSTVETPDLAPFVQLILDLAFRQALGTRISAIDLAPFALLFSEIGTTRAELSLPAGATTPLALRMTIDPEELTLFDSEPMWQAFRAGTLFAAPTGHDFSLIVDGQSVANILSTFLTSALKDKIADGAFTLEQGPTGRWSFEDASASLHGSINDACNIVFVQIDMGTEFTLTLTPSCPAANTVHFDIAIDVDTNKLAVVVCSFATAVGFWFEAIKFLNSDQLKPGEYIAGSLFEITEFSWVLVGLLLDKLSSPPIQDQLPDQAGGYDLTKVEPTSHSAEVSTDIVLDPGSIPGVGAMTLNTITGSAVGPVFSGALAFTPVAVQADMTVVKTDWAWAPLDRCSPDNGYQVTASISYYLQDSTAQQVKICGVKVLKHSLADSSIDLDPKNQFAAAKVTRDTGAQLVTFTIAQTQVTSGYTSAPYHCYVWFDTDAGKRVIDLGSFGPLTDAIKEKFETQALAPACTGVESAKLWAGQWNPHWAVDPGPVDWQGVQQLWKFAVSGLPSGDIITAVVGDQQIVAAPTVDGLSQLTAWTTPESAELALERKLQNTGALDAGQRLITMHQVLLSRTGSVRCSVAPMIESASFATGTRGWLAIASRGGVELCDVSRPNCAVPMPGIAARELRGICAANQRLITYGDRGLKVWRWTGDRWLSVHTLALDGIRDVSHTSGRIAVLHGEVITVYDRRWSATSTTKHGGARAIVLDDRALHVATLDGVERHELATST